ncbi:MAG: SIS domain-containing protein [Woeseiaceae bacterium]|nr:SIS domain-containing protein [Woeseiaceae bacterium]
MTSIALKAASIGEDLAGRQPTREVFFVGCGASLADLYPAKYFLKERSASLRVDSYPSNEFVHATPRALGERSVVIACSHGGGTKETVESMRIAQDAGAFTVALTNNASAKISTLASKTLIYEWGDETAVTDNPIAITLALALEILARTEGVEDYDKFRRALESIDEIVGVARRDIHKRTRNFADVFRDESFFYLLSSGAVPARLCFCYLLIDGDAVAKRQRDSLRRVLSRPVRDYRRDDPIHPADERGAYSPSR